MVNLDIFFAQLAFLFYSDPEKLGNVSKHNTIANICRYLVQLNNQYLKEFPPACIADVSTPSGFHTQGLHAVPDKIWVAPGASLPECCCKALRTMCTVRGSILKTGCITSI
jgi:hypothetical protein